MGKPSSHQIAEAIIHSAQLGECDAEFDARIAGLGRMSDAELAAMGIVPRAETAAPKSTKQTKQTRPPFSFFRLPRALRRTPQS